MLILFTSVGKWHTALPVNAVLVYLCDPVFPQFVIFDLMTFVEYAARTHRWSLAVIGWRPRPRCIFFFVRLESFFLGNFPHEHQTISDHISLICFYDKFLKRPFICKSIIIWTDHYNSSERIYFKFVHETTYFT